jgi:RecB family exonuclease
MAQCLLWHSSSRQATVRHKERDIMGVFRNEFSWSVTRHRLFQECRRRYYYAYYGSHGGWLDTADADTRRLYTLKKMTTIPMLIGTVTHETIKDIINGLRAGRVIPAESAEERVVERFRAAWQESARGEWRLNPTKKTNLFEHYYGVTLSRDRLLRIKDTLTGNIRGFYGSTPYNELHCAPEKVLVCEDFASFLLEDLKVYVRLDCAVRRPDGIVIYDWKTGEYDHDDPFQLGIYALYADDAWKVAPEAVRVQTVYLRGEPTVSTGRQIDPATVRAKIRDSAAAMKACLDDPLTNAASIERFPKTEHTSQCSLCPFKRVCRPESLMSKEDGIRPSGQTTPPDHRVSTTGYY